MFPQNSHSGNYGQTTKTDALGTSDFHKIRTLSPWGNTPSMRRFNVGKSHFGSVADLPPEHDTGRPMAIQ
jgi:hypothetical protein